jgi:hypothetical protein
MGHEQTCIKVNAMVDKGIAPLVEALNLFPGVVTLSSCEGNEDGRGYVAFTVDNDGWQQVGEFLSDLSLSLRNFPDLCDETSFSLCLEWYTGSEVPTAYLRVQHKHIRRLAQAIREVAAATVHQEVVP